METQVNRDITEFVSIKSIHAPSDYNENSYADQYMIDILFKIGYSVNITTRVDYNVSDSELYVYVTYINKDAHFSGLGNVDVIPQNVKRDIRKYSISTLTLIYEDVVNSIKENNEQLR
ncbi:MAG: hypothetical protein J07AB43_00530 [Candidatus Nanosalina sp. J07AB43]|jgi:hypothetical protein|nr:MAG: hypothetical protein J07AB43_00530 [Candidatus Nanosalina sp. J07AB43]